MNAVFDSFQVPEASVAVHDVVHFERRPLPRNGLKQPLNGSLHCRRVSRLIGQPHRGITEVDGWMTQLYAVVESGSVVSAATTRTRQSSRGTEKMLDSSGQKIL